MLNIFRDFLYNNLLVPVIALTGGALFLYLIAKYGESIFNFLLNN